MQKITVPPDPRRLINGLRDTGYSFNVAVADLVDNSISANALLFGYFRKSLYSKIRMYFRACILLLPICIFPQISFK